LAWEKSLRELEDAKAQLARREQLSPRTLSANERTRLLALGADLYALLGAFVVESTALDRLINPDPADSEWR
jgi:hypothetical protein